MLGEPPNLLMAIEKPGVGLVGFMWESHRDPAGLPTLLLPTV